VTGSRNPVDDYLSRVERLLGDLAADDRAGLLEDLHDQLEETSVDPETLLGSPEEFAAEFRRSAGIEESVTAAPSAITSGLALVVAFLLLFSFGAQLFVGPTVLVLGWYLARASSSWLRIAWCVVAALLAGEVAYFWLSGAHWPERYLEILGALAVGLGVGGFFLVTTRMPPSRHHVADAALSTAAVGSVTLWIMAARGDLLLVIIASATVFAIAVALTVLSRRRR
jgi:uncharacterized membrane protein